MTLDLWLQSHAYLNEVARVRAEIDEAVGAATHIVPAPASWDDYAEDYVTGVPLLQGEMPIDLHPAGQAVISTLSRLSIDVSGATADRIVDWLLGDDNWTPDNGGLVRTAGWLAMTASLRPLLNSFNAWKDDERWLRRYCPCCGSLPAMAQLAGDEPGRMRLLTCGRCATQWRYGRTMCPFCETDQQKQLSIVIEGESGLRVDHCESCNGYVKTYAGQGDEAVLLADWTSLHLDQLALDRGLKRLSASLFVFG